MIEPAYSPTPERIFEALNAYQKSASLKAAIELDVFTAIGEEVGSAADLAKRCETSERGMRILCDYLVVQGFLTKEDYHYRLTPETAAFLNRHSPAYIGSVAKFLNSPRLVESFEDVAAVVRKGGTVTSEEGTVSAENPIWLEFARSMASLQRPVADGIAKLINAACGEPWKVLDIAAGHGLFGIAIARHNPNAQIVALDWPGVVAIARENAQAEEMADRFHTLAGSAFEVDYGCGYDLVLVTNFFHHFDAPTCQKLMAKIYNALKNGGRVVTLEFVPNEDRVSPAIAATFSMVMLGTTAAGDAYTFSEYDRMFRSAGFNSNEIHPLPLSPGQVIISHKL